MTLPIHDFHFIRPMWLLALVPLLILFIAVRKFRAKQSGWQQVIAPHLYRHLVTGENKPAKQPPLWLLFWCWSLATIALAGPTWERLPQPVFQVQQGHVVVLDMSLSMRATDISPDRLTRAKYKAIDLIHAIDEGEMGLVAYAGDAFTISPLTTDAGNLVALLPGLSPEIMPVSGSDPYRGLSEAADLLTNAGYQQGDIYWITDGISMDQNEDIVKLLSDLPYRVNILGVGTDQGAPIRQLNGELLKDRYGQIVIPKMRSDQLSNIARRSGGSYATISADDSDIKTLLSNQWLNPDAKESDEKSTNDGDQWDELGPWLLLLIIPFAAYSFRRGLIAVFVILPWIWASPSPAVAQTTSNETPPHSISWYKKPFLNSDQQGLEAYKADDYATASKQFKDPAWRGAAAYKEGNYDAALEAFSQAEGAAARYNQGNTLAQLGKLDEAIEQYEQALVLQPDFADAKANKELVEKLKQQQEQQKQQDQDKNQQQSEDDKDKQQQNDGAGNNSSNQDNNSDGQDNGQNSPQNNDQGNSSNSNENNDQQGADSSLPQQDDNKPSDEGSEDQSGEQNKEDNQATENESPSSAAAQSGEENQDATTKGVEGQPAELTDEEKEKMQRLENLMKKIPDDPAFLLKRKMQLEAQQRKRQGPPSNRSEW